MLDVIGWFFYNFYFTTLYQDNVVLDGKLCNFLLFISFPAPAAFIETLRERMFKPSLSTIITENMKYAI